MDYILKRTTRSASIRISLGHDARVLVTAPRLIPKVFVDRFVDQNQEWIKRQKLKMELKKTANPSLNWSDKILSYLGRLYSIKVTAEPGEKVELHNGICWIRPITGLTTDAKKTLLSWLKTRAEGHINERAHFWADKMNVRFSSVRFGQQSSRWGSCSGENNLRFNWRLIHFSSEVIDYVVIHELAHTVHHDHSGRFWDLVEHFCPGWKEQRKFLKRQAVSIETM